MRVGAGGGQLRARTRVVATLALLLLPLAARANEASQALAARALIALHEGRTAEARALLDDAVAADPDDAEVRYQRGVLRSRADDAAGAVEDLERALALRPYFPVAALELGIAQLDAGNPSEAEAPLLQAQQVPALDAQASFYLALAQVRLGRLDAARTNLARARQGDPSLATAIQYYEGVIAFRERDYDAAETSFAAVQRDRPDSAIGREAEQYLTVIAETRTADFSAFGTMALEYDSNVTLGPGQTIPGSVSGQGDWRASLDGGARWTPLRWGGASLSVSYEFFQSLQFQLTSYNLQDHRPAVQLQYDVDWVSFGVLGRYDYYLLGGDTYLSEFTAFPWVTLREEGFGRTEIYARIQPRNFWGDYDVLNGIYSFAGARQFLDLGNASRQLWIGYQLGFTSPENSDDVEVAFERDQYQYGSLAAEAGIRSPLPFDIYGELAYRYERQSYAAASGCFPSTPSAPNPGCLPGQPLPPGLTRRADNDHRVILSLERPLYEVWDHLSVVLAYFGTFNDSNKSVFQYNRNIGSLALQVRY
jgi:tetratricopeptide (TPR) repeat protein